MWSAEVIRVDSGELVIIMSTNRAVDTYRAIDEPDLVSFGFTM
jgi:hypothetical protein